MQSSAELREKESSGGEAVSYRELVEDTLTYDWQSTAKIASVIPYRFIDRTSHLREVYEYLCKFERWGIAEK